MTIRFRLMALFLPPLLFLVSISTLFLYNLWEQEILSSYRASLESAVVTCSQLIDADEHQILERHKGSSRIKDNASYKQYMRLFRKMKKKLPISKLYTLRIKPVQKGELVLADQKASETNHHFDGHNPEYAFRQIYILNSSENVSSESPEERFDYSQSGEHRIYYTREVILTPVYLSKKTQTHLMSAFAPLVDRDGQVRALVAADVDAEIIHPKLQRAKLIIFASATTSVILIIFGVFFIAHRISQPVQALKNTALAIAAGDYTISSKLKGPQEILELGNALETMSACLNEQMTRIKEHSILRQRMQGENECAQCLQQLIFDETVGQFQSDDYSLFAVSSYSQPPLLGVELQATEVKGKLSIYLKESREKGLLGIYSLIKGESYRTLSSLNIEGDKLLIEGEANLLFWCNRSKDYVDNPTAFSKDMLAIFYSSDTQSLFTSAENLRESVRKVLKHFGDQPSELLKEMLVTELSQQRQIREETLSYHLACLRTK
jgi:HAMP domain-containing protein